MELAKTLIVVPAYNEAKVIAKTIEKLKNHVKDDILVVDDGSIDKTFENAEKTKVKVVRHPINLGLGAAIQTGFAYAKKKGYSQLITFDGDGQHNPEDIKKLKKTLDIFDVAVGVRTINRETMPVTKKIGNILLNILTAIFFGVYSSDSQSGLRGFNKIALEKMNITTNRYEVSSEILYEAKKANLKIGETPIDVIYTSHSIENGTNVGDGLKILWRMILHKTK